MRRKIKEYTIIYSWSQEVLIELISTQIERGFVPQGGVSAFYDRREDGQTLYAQAMVLYHDAL